jgi:peptide/nickel transport system substrate-binding protein
MLMALSGMPGPVPHATARRALASPAYLTVGGSGTAFTRNFSVFSASANAFTLGAIYEPLIVITEPPASPHTYPWLATGYRWTNGDRTLVVTVRSGVRWSDGQPFTAADVVFTYTYGKRYAAADQEGLWSGKVLRGVSASGNQVRLDLTEPDTADLWRIVNGVFIVPRHIFAAITNPAAYLNPNPVGTGPFAVVRDFTGQSYVLGRNPYYWQPPAYDGVRVLALSSDNANLALIDGTLDWTGDFVPNVQKAYVARDPAHFHYLYADISPIGLYFNDERYPFSLPVFRAAISHAVDRARISRIAEYGYEQPSDALGMAVPYPAWTDPRLAAQAKDMATYDVRRAASMLARAGFTTKGGRLFDPRGAGVSVTLSSVSGWTDWALAMQILQGDLRKLGIDAPIQLLSLADWFEQVNRGLLSAHLMWIHAGNTPYDIYESFMSAASYARTGAEAGAVGSNWARYRNAEADRLLAQFRQTTDSGKQHAALDRIQAIFLRDLPWIPVVYAAAWYTYSTLHFTGFPTRADFYADGSPSDAYSAVVVLTHLKPVA